MNIILVPEGIRKGRIASFSHRHLLVMGLVAVVFMPALLTTVTYQIVEMLGHGTSAAQVERIKHQQALLAAQRLEIDKAKRHTETHMNALAQRMGHLQAQVMRLDALGGRLTQMAGIDTKEFDFTKRPGVGGPAEPVASFGENDLFGLLKTLDHQVARQSEQLRALQAVLISNNTQTALTPSGWPVKGGWVSSNFGLRADPFTGRTSMHQGVDIASPLRSTISAMGDGVVTYAGERRGYGMLVEINHGQGYSTRYAHAGEVLVAVGDRVSKGQPVARVGLTGRSTGPHLHFEVMKNRHHIDPTAFLQRHQSATTVKATRVGAGRS
jgi:murein DD-endopeptidase MepM/ murein hydrolase activator NlpD